MHTCLQKIFIDELKDILSAEEQIVKNLPAMIKAAEFPALKIALKSHWQETKAQVQRVKEIFKIMGVKPTKKFCKGTHGIVEEIKEVIKEFSESPVRDAGMTAVAIRLEQYEICAYNGLCTFAKLLKLPRVLKLLKENAKEEIAAFKKLTKILEKDLTKIITSEIRVEAPRKKIAKKLAGRKSHLAFKSRTVSAVKRKRVRA